MAKRKSLRELFDNAFHKKQAKRGEEEPVAKEAVSEETVADESVAEKSAAEETVAEETVAEGSAAKQADAEPSPSKKRKSDLFYDAYGLLVKIGWIALSLFLLLQFVVGVHTNSGVQMEPSFHDRDVVFYFRLASDYEAGDVVVFKGQNGSTLVGRIVAKSGDTVDISDGGLKLNGYFQTEPYAKGETVLFENGVAFPVTLREDEYFILFDNRSQGGDGRVIGKVSSGDIKGHVVLTVRARDF